MTVEVYQSSKFIEVASKLGLRSELVNRWKREYQERKEDSFLGKGKPSLTAE